jgi:hypothetical protein
MSYMTASAPASYIAAASSHSHTVHKLAAAFYSFTLTPASIHNCVYKVANILYNCICPPASRHVQVYLPRLWHMHLYTYKSTLQIIFFSCIYRVACVLTLYNCICTCIYTPASPHTCKYEVVGCGRRLYKCRCIYIPAWISILCMRI